MPNATEMIKLMLDEEHAYRLLSAVAHGHIWAIRQLGFAQAGATFVGPDGVSMTPMLKHSGTLEGYTYLAVRAAKSFARPLWNQCQYFGWDEARLKALLDSVYDEFRGSVNIRFWR